LYFEDSKKNKGEAKEKRREERRRTGDERG
jgi:hypothetical protein